MAFFHNGRQGGSGGPYLKWTTKNNPSLSIRGVFPQINAEVGKALIVVDYRTTAAAWGKFGDGVPQIVAWPYRTPPLPQPSGYKKCVVFQVLVHGYTGILPWIVDAEYPMNRMGSYFEQYEAYPEAIADKLPVYRYIGNDPNKHPVYPNDTFYSPRFEIIDWMPRPKEFGEPTVPPPPPKLPDEAETPVALPPVPPPANDATAAAPFDGGQPYRPIPAAPPAPAAPAPAAAASSATDLLAKYVRRQ
jgi:hypothetical protein